MPSKTTFENGLRVVTEEMPHMQSVTTAIFVSAGSRHESVEINGMTHFLEHMLFKGSAKRDSALKIAKDIESVGGVLNGFTHQEATCYYAKTLSENSPLAFDVLADMVLQPLLAAEEVEKERPVVIQEIRMVKDIPQHWVHDLLQEKMWEGQALGRSIAGSEEVIGRVDRETIVAYHQRHYQPQNIVVAAAGRVTHEQVVALADLYFGALPGGQAVPCDDAVDRQARPEVIARMKDTEQAHFCVGLRGLPREDPEEYTVGVMNTALGVGMSSRLFQEIREKRGLAYAVSSHHHSFRDAGALVVYAGVDPAKLGDALGAVLDELRKLKLSSLGEAELAEAKQFSKGVLLLQLENTNAWAMMLGEHELLTGKLITVSEIVEKIEAVRCAGIHELADRLFHAGSLTLAVIHPDGTASSENLEELLRL